MPRRVEVRVLHEKGEALPWCVALYERGDSAAVRMGELATQTMAIAAGRELAQVKHAELLVQGRDGKIRIADSHGRDSRRRKG